MHKGLAKYVRYNEVFCPHDFYYFCDGEYGSSSIEDLVI